VGHLHSSLALAVAVAVVAACGGSLSTTGDGGEPGADSPSGSGSGGSGSSGSSDGDASARDEGMQDAVTSPMDATVDSAGDVGEVDVVADAASGGEAGDASVCTPGDFHCTSNYSAEVCGWNGQWSTFCCPLCPSCDPGGCCPGQTQCFGNSVLTCAASGITWGPAVACSGSTPACLNGSCVACSPGATQCSGNGVQTCTANGTWNAPVACPSGCGDGGACI